MVYYKGRLSVTLKKVFLLLRNKVMIFSLTQKTLLFEN